MDNFSARDSYLDLVLDDVLISGQDYQFRDFESVWNLAEPLTDEEKELFELPTNKMDPLIDDPLLTTAGLAELPPLMDFLPAEPDSSADNDDDREIIDPVGDDSADMDYPISIHSYSLPPKDFTPENSLAGDEIHYSDDSDEPLERRPTPVIAASTGRRMSARQPKRRRFSDSEDDDDDENQSENLRKRPKKDTFSNGKRKLYKSGPFNDPEMERARLNAINAKRNRDRKKQEKTLLENEMTKLKNENQGLKRTASKMRERAINAEAELKRLREMLRANNLEAVLKATGNGF